MKKQLVILGILALLFSVGLGGCNGNPFDIKNNQVPSQIEILNYSVQTKWSTYGELGIIDKDYYEDGFYQDIPSNVSDFHKYYIISGTVKNICDRMITIQLNAVYYDGNGVELFKGSDYSIGANYRGSTIRDLPSGYNRTFSINLLKKTFYDLVDYFDEVESFKWAITVSYS